MQDPDAETPPAPTPPDPSSIRLVALDLDGTLLTDQKQVALRTVKAIRRLAESGTRVVIASARPPRSVRQIYTALNLDTWQINYNGALIWDEPAKKAVFHAPMSPELVRVIVDDARSISRDVLVSFEVLDRWYTDRFEQTYTTETGRLFKPDVVAPLNLICNRPITKLLLLGEPDLIVSIHARLAGLFGERVAIVRAEPELLQIMDHTVSKGTGLRFVAGHYGIPLANTLAIGDAVNDVEMLQVAGIPVAMSNAPESVRQHAKWLAPSNNDHGVYEALKFFKLAD